MSDKKGEKSLGLKDAFKLVAIVGGALEPRKRWSGITAIWEMTIPALAYNSGVGANNENKFT